MIMDNTSSFFTKAFFIRFCEEEIDLNDFCHFRIEFDVKPKYELTELIMEAELMFIDCMGNNDNKNKNDEKKETNDKNSQNVKI
jgi:hypothetical protein